MTTSADLSRHSPEELQAQIAATRASLHMKLHELERRLSPRARVAELRSRVHPDEYVGAAAVAAIAVGMLLAIAGWRRTRRYEEEQQAYLVLEDPQLADMLCE